MFTPMLVAATIMFSIGGMSDPTAPIDNTVTIHNDLGGEMIQYAISAKETTKVKFEGPCMSSCTLYLAVKDICITKDVKFGFHMPFGKSQKQNEKAKDYLLSQYPQWVVDYINSHGGLSDKMIYINYKTAIKHIKACEMKG